MRNYIITAIIVMSQLLRAQPTDFSRRIENSFLKLYENPNTAISAAKAIKDSKGEAEINCILAQAYRLKGDYPESVIVAFENPRPDDPQGKIFANITLAQEFFHLNLYEHALKVAETTLHEIPTSQHSQATARLLQLKGKILAALNQYSNAEICFRQSSGVIKKDNNPINLLIQEENNLLIAEAAYYSGDKVKAKFETDELLTKLSQKRHIPYLSAEAHRLRAQLFFDEQEYEEALQHLKKAEKLISETDFIPLKAQIYQDLARNYLVAARNSEYELYKNKASETVGLLEDNKKNARRDLVQKATENAAEISRAEIQNKKKLVFYTGTVLLAILSVLSAFLWKEILRSRNLMKQIRFFRTALHYKKSDMREVHQNTKANTAKKSLSIPPEKEKEILKGLETFEMSGKFLEKNMSLASLASELNTNTKYLSEIINTYKNKNFNGYINDLRIRHIIHLLSTDRSHLQYKISYIAELGGFTSHSAFTNVFKSVTGMSPNEYIQTLKREA